MKTTILYLFVGVVGFVCCGVLVARDMPQNVLVTSTLGLAAHSGQHIPVVPAEAPSRPSTQQIARNIKIIPQKIITKVQATRHIIKTQRGSSKWYDFRHIVLYMIIAVGILCLALALADLKNYLAIPIVLLGVLLAIYLLQLMYLLR